MPDLCMLVSEIMQPPTITAAILSIRTLSKNHKTYARPRLGMVEVSIFILGPYGRILR